MSWNELLNQVLVIILPILGSILTAVASYVAIKIKATLETKATDEVKQLIAQKIVAFIDQTMTNATNSEKIDSALATASQWLLERNITVSDTELKVLIESAVNAAHKQLSPTDTTNNAA